MSRPLQGLRLGWGPGPGDRLLAPGLPDALFGDGKRLGWLNRDGAWLLQDDEVRLDAIANPVGVATCSEGWTVVQSIEEGWCVHRIDWGSGQARETRLSGRSVVAGWTWAIVDEGMQRRLIDLETEKAPRLPLGAREAHPRPWTDGPGLTWLGGTTVYRMGADLRVRVAGTLPGKPVFWTAGPRGSAMFALETGTWGMGPGSGPMPLPEIDTPTARFGPEGDRLLATGEGRLLEIDLSKGSVIREKRGDFTPVGYAPGAVALEERTGLLRFLEHGVLASGFSPCASVQDGHRLFGPGGTAWDLETGQALWAHAPLKGEHLAVVGDQIISVADEIELFDGNGERSRHFPVPLDPDTEGPIYEVRADPPDHIWLELEAEQIRVALDGRRVGAPSPISADDQADQTQLMNDGYLWDCRMDVPEVVRMDPDGNAAARWPVFAESVSVVGTRAWCWNDDGMLLSLDLSNLPEGTSG